MDSLDVPGLEEYGANPWSLVVTGLLVALTLPGVVSLVQRTGQPKFVEKTYVMAGAAAAGGLETRSVAGGLFAYFKRLNYTMDSDKQKGKVRFVGEMEASLSQAFYVTTVVASSIFAVGLCFNGLFPDGIFGLGPGIFYFPMIAAPAAGAYYWQRAFRRDIVEVQLLTSDDDKELTLQVLGDKETLDEMQSGVRFMSPEGNIVALNEEGMEYEPGLLSVNSPMIYSAPPKQSEEVSKVPKAA